MQSINSVSWGECMAEFIVTQHAQQRFWERFPGEHLQLALMYSHRLSFGQIRKILQRTGMSHFAPDTVLHLNEDIGAIFVTTIASYDPLTYTVITVKYLDPSRYPKRKGKPCEHQST